MSWLPIETAPKDGTVVYVWADWFKWPAAASYVEYIPEAAELVGQHGYWQHADEAYFGDGIERWRSVGDDDCVRVGPTRWKPLPEPNLPDITETET